jgi:hypothetical protein
MIMIAATTKMNIKPHTFLQNIVSFVRSVFYIACVEVFKKKKHNKGSPMKRLQKMIRILTVVGITISSSPTTIGTTIGSASSCCPTGARGRSRPLCGGIRIIITIKHAYASPTANFTIQTGLALSGACVFAIYAKLVHAACIFRNTVDYGDILHIGVASLMDVLGRRGGYMCCIFMCEEGAVRKGVVKKKQEKDKM